jgi:rhodanese-related sulfurtransferase
MSPAASSLPALRRLLSERFPQAARAPASVLRTGVPLVDETAGGLPRHAVTEIVCAAPSCGGQLFVGQLLAATRVNRLRVALVDSTDSFDPGSYSADDLVHLLWVRCDRAEQALQATDLLARDANFGLVLLDLRHAAEADLRRIPNRQWYLLQRAVESTDLALVIVTPRALVSSAQLRLELSHSHGIAALDHDRPILATGLAPTLQRQRIGTHASPATAVA